MRFGTYEAHVDLFLALEYSASEPYSTFVYDTPDQAKQIARYLLECDVGEFAAPHGCLAFDDGDRPVGMVSFLDGVALQRARLASAMALVRGRRIDPDSEVRTRMLLASETLMTVDADDLYLSRIAVASEFQGQGVAGRMITQFEAVAREMRKRRLVLEVSPTHTAAVSLYARCGFVQTALLRTNIETRELIYTHMVKML